VTIELETLVDN